MKFMQTTLGLAAVSFLLVTSADAAVILDFGSDPGKVGSSGTAGTLTSGPTFSADSMAFSTDVAFRGTQTNLPTDIDGSGFDLSERLTLTAKLGVDSPTGQIIITLIPDDFSSKREYTFDLGGLNTTSFVTIEANQILSSPPFGGTALDWATETVGVVEIKKFNEDGTLISLDVDNLGISGTPIPEPTSALVGAAALGFLGMRRRKLG